MSLESAMMCYIRTPPHTMCWNKYFARTRPALAVLFSAFAFGNALALAPATVVLPDSTKPVAASPVTTGESRPFVSRQALTSAETTASITFEVALKMRNFPELQARVGRGEHVTQAEMAAKYEPLPADYQAVLTWLKGAGFTIVRTDPHHMAIFASGSVSRIGSAFKVTFARVTSDGKDYTSAVTAPSVPADIAALLVGINGLQPHLHAHKHLLKPQAQPGATTGSASYVPSQIAQAYGVTPLYNSSILGGGQTIAIVIDTFPSTTDLLLFWKNCSVNQSISNIEFVQAVPGALPSPSGEETLDTEWSSAMAPQAHIRVYACVTLSNTDLDMAYQSVYADATNHPELGLHQMSMSYGEGETYTTQTQVNTDDQYFAELAAAGVTPFASSGDGGATPGPNGGGDKSGPVQVESPASDPNVIGVGGTSLTLDSSNNVSTEVVWNNGSGASGGGESIYFSETAAQTAAGISSSGERAVPDIAATADPNFGAIVYLQGAETVYGGTSWACPIWAALCALTNQARASAGETALGSGGSSTAFNAQAYSLLGSSTYSTEFRDILSGTNNTRGSNGFSAGTGYDFVTGIGSPKVQALTQGLVGSSTLVGVQMPAPVVSIQPAQDATFTVAAGGGSATYQWQRKPIGSASWTNLNDNSTYGGSTTASLSILGATPAMNGDQFHCVVTLSSSCVVTTTPTALVVDTPLVISTLAGSVGNGALENGTGTGAEFNIPSGIAVDTSGNLFIADFLSNAIREVTPAGVVTTPYGSLSATAGSTNGSGNGALFNNPNGIAADLANNLYVADTGNNLIRKIASGSATTFGAGGNFKTPEGVAVDSSGNVYVADTGNNTIREINSAGVVTTLAGQKGTAGYQDGNATTQALFNAPSAVAVDAFRNVYVADFGNSVIRKISGGQVTTVAGQGGVAGYRDGPAGAALFNTPSGIALDGSGNIYVADCLVPPLNTNAAGNNLVRKISPAGAVSTLAGQPGNEGSSDGTGAGAQFYSVQAVALNNSTGAVYLADTYNQTIRMGVPEAPPTLSVVATVPTATVFGLVPGQITLTRTGDVSAGLTVSYNLSGSAAAATDYAAMPTIATIPAGMTSAVVMVDPIADSNVTSSPTLQLTLNSAAGYTLGNPATATVTIEEVTPYQAWSTKTFGTDAVNPAIGSETADPNHNGVPNLLEYAFNSDPLQTGTEPLPVVSTMQVGNDEYLAITYNMLTSAPNLSYTVQVTSDLSGATDSWHSGSSATTVVQQTASGDVTQVIVRDNTPISSVNHRFIRVQVSEN